MADDSTDRLVPTRTVLEGLSMLEEPSTTPSASAPERYPTKAIQKLFDQFFLAMPDSVLSRGLPFIEDIFLDETFRLPHIWICLKVSFKEPTSATIASVREELEVLAALMSRLFERGVVISAEIDPGDADG